MKKIHHILKKKKKKYKLHEKKDSYDNKRERQLVDLYRIYRLVLIL